MIPISSEWAIASQMPGKKWFAARFYYGDGKKYLSVGSKDFELNDERFLGIISNKPAIRGGYDMQTRDFLIAGGVIELLNHIDQATTFGLLASTLDSDGVGFENRTVDLRLMKDGISKFENGFPLLEVGRMYRPQYKDDKVVIKVEDDSSNLFGSVGELVTEADATPGYDLPSQSAGLTKPIIYGNHRWTIGATGSATPGEGLLNTEWFPDKPRRFVPMIYLGGDRWMVEGHEIAGTPAILEGDQIWAVNSFGGGWKRLAAYTVIKNDGTGVVIAGYTPGTGETWFDYTLPESVANVGTTNFTDPDNAIDKDVATGATISLVGVNNNGILRFTFPEKDYGDLFLGAALFVTGDGDWGGANQLFMEGNLNWYYPSSGIDPSIADYFLNSFGVITTEANIEEIDLTFRSPDAGPNVADIFDVYRRVEFSARPEDAQLAWGGLGHALELWVDEAIRSSHYDYGNAGDGAENPVSSIESLARNDGGFTDDNINMPTFDTASNDLAGALANFDIRKRTKLKPFLAAYARQFKSVINLSVDSKLQMDVIKDKYTSADMMVSYNDAIRLSFERTDDDQLIAEVQVEYSYDGSKYTEKTDEVSNSTTRTRYNLNPLVGRRDLKADKINDLATAVALGDWELAFWQQHHNTIDEIVLDESFMALEPNDILGLIDIPENKFPNGEDVTRLFTRAGQDILPFFKIITFTKSDVVEYGGIQMHDTTP